MDTVRSFLKDHILFLDGAVGSVLQRDGLKPGELPELWNITHKDKIIALHYAYYAAGSNIINTNTFGATTAHFEKSRLKTVIAAALDNAFLARSKYLLDSKSSAKSDTFNKFISFDLGPTGKLLKPMGDLDFEDAVNIYKTSIEIALSYRYKVADGEEAWRDHSLNDATLKTPISNCVDCVTLETFGDVYEAKAAIIALKETQEKLGTAVPVLMSFAFDKSARTLTGSTPSVVTAIMEGLGVDALGVNCSLGPRDMLPVIDEFLRYSSTPIIVKPNAGLPRDDGGIPVYDVDSVTFAHDMADIAKKGVTLLGGCCGTDATYIKNLVDAVKKVTPLKKPSLYNSEKVADGGDSATDNFIDEKKLKKDICVAASYNKAVYFRNKKEKIPPVLIGERINPTGKRLFKDALRKGDIDYITNEALKQEESGAMALDVNVGLPEIDEKAMMVRVMEAVQSVTTLPLQIDTTDPAVMEAALRRYNGKALINSVNGKRDVMEKIFPIVKKYGGVVVALLLDEGGIPVTAKGRLDIAKKIYETAARYGVDRRDILIDSLTMAVSSDTSAGRVTLDVIKEITATLGRTVLGVSNISFGLPMRSLVTSAFFTMALEAGLSAGIVNVCDSAIGTSYKTYCLLDSLDDNCISYIDWANKLPQDPKSNVIFGTSTTVSAKTPETLQKNARATEKGEGTWDPLCHSIIHGATAAAERETKKLLDDGLAATAIIDSFIMKALNYVGECFEKKTMYLPQLLMASDATKSAFAVIKETMKSASGGGPKIIVATVKGDIHDIGKNIVKTLLENYGFNVIDLGKDVDPKVVVARCKSDDVKMVGLSALMTTTVVSMEETIALLRRECPDVKVCVGGAVMTQTYADKIGADFYAKDAMATVAWAKSQSGSKE